MQMSQSRRGFYRKIRGKNAREKCEKEKPFEERFFPSRALLFPNLFKRSFSCWKTTFFARGKGLLDVFLDQGFQVIRNRLVCLTCFF